MHNYKMRKCHAREELVPRRSKRPIKDLLLNSDMNVGLPVHFQLGLMMQFSNFLDKGGNCCRCLYKAPQGLTTTRKSSMQAKPRGFDGPHSFVNPT